MDNAFSSLIPNQFPVSILGTTGIIGVNTNYVALKNGSVPSGFQSQYQDQISNADQAHHFAAFFQLGFAYGAGVGSLAATWYERLEGTAGNQGDILLGMAASQIGAYVKSGVLPISESPRRCVAWSRPGSPQWQQLQRDGSIVNVKNERAQVQVRETLDQEVALLWLRCHAPLGASFESVCVAGMRRGGGATWDEALLIARGMLWSMSRIAPFRALLATGVNECRALVDVLVASAPRAVLPVSVSKIQAMRPSER